MRSTSILENHDNPNEPALQINPDDIDSGRALPLLDLKVKLTEKEVQLKETENKLRLVEAENSNLNNLKKILEDLLLKARKMLEESENSKKEALENLSDEMQSAIDDLNSRSTDISQDDLKKAKEDTRGMVIAFMQEELNKKNELIFELEFRQKIASVFHERVENFIREKRYDQEIKDYIESQIQALEPHEKSTFLKLPENQKGKEEEDENAFAKSMFNKFKDRLIRKLYSFGGGANSQLISNQLLGDLPEKILHKIKIKINKKILKAREIALEERLREFQGLCFSELQTLNNHLSLKKAISESKAAELYREFNRKVDIDFAPLHVEVRNRSIKPEEIFTLMKFAQKATANKVLLREILNGQKNSSKKLENAKEKDFNYIELLADRLEQLKNLARLMKFASDHYIEKSKSSFSFCHRHGALGRERARKEADDFSIFVSKDLSHLNPHFLETFDRYLAKALEKGADFKTSIDLILGQNINQFLGDFVNDTRGDGGNYYLHSWRTYQSLILAEWQAMLDDPSRRLTNAEGQELKNFEEFKPYQDLVREIKEPGVNYWDQRKITAHHIVNVLSKTGIFQERVADAKDQDKKGINKKLLRDTRRYSDVKKKVVKARSVRFKV